FLLQMDHDPRTPVYIAAQAPLANTVVDFWQQMVWESGCTVVVMLTPLMENRVEHCYRYWPEEGSRTYHIYEVNLVSEHVWCEDFLVRSLYLKNALTAETRTLTQFHYLSWPDQAAPSSAASLLDFRRQEPPSLQQPECPTPISCQNVYTRPCTYLYICSALSKFTRSLSTKEIDIAATLEFIRDQRLGMVETKEQFGFALTAVAEEVNAILRSLPT
uniref:Tyrosine-protein phosphatase domain-containing protein n=1 Tax=Petromyzon marinus TaxID=7757 RepID=S4RBD9_PETMA